MHSTLNFKVSFEDHAAMSKINSFNLYCVKIVTFAYIFLFKIQYNSKLHILVYNIKNWKIVFCYPKGLLIYNFPVCTLYFYRMLSNGHQIWWNLKWRTFLILNRITFVAVQLFWCKIQFCTHQIQVFLQIHTYWNS